VYPNPFNTESPYTGQAPYNDRCPICGAVGECNDAVTVAMPYPAVDLNDAAEDSTTGALRPYDVTVFGYTTVMRLNDTDAARYGGAAVLKT
jgi:hypothetical protein